MSRKYDIFAGKTGMYYYIWCDESDKHGEYYSNFYGGVLVKSEDYDFVLRESAAFVERLGINEEIKWQKVNEHWFDKYSKIVDFVFKLLSDGKIKIRIFFRNNQYVPVGLTREQIRKEYPMLYYQFIKHAFGLQYSNQTQEPVFIHLMLDDIPLKGSDKEEFKNYIFGLNFDESFKKANIHIHKDEISEVDSSKHIMLQFMDLILGAVCFRLNNKHKIKDQATGRRGKRTILKEKLYRHINSRIREIYPNFNIGISTGCNDFSDRWTHPYRHWTFIPTSSIRDISLSKGHKNSPCASTE